MELSKRNRMGTTLARGSQQTGNARADDGRSNNWGVLPPGQYGKVVGKREEEKREQSLMVD
jgi:hypothetical protein